MDPPAPAGAGAGGWATACPRARSTGWPASSPSSSATAAVLAFNLSPGFVATERIAMDMAGFGFDARAGAPADVVGRGGRLAGHRTRGA